MTAETFGAFEGGLNYFFGGEEHIFIFFLGNIEWGRRGEFGEFLIDDSERFFEILGCSMNADVSPHELLE